MFNIMTAEYVRDQVFPVVWQLLPAPMASQRAEAMLLAIGFQESRFLHRKQLADGPARGFWQFERNGGVLGVLTHTATAPLAGEILRRLAYGTATAESYEAIAHNDALACVFARLLLWTLPGVLPEAHEAERGWSQYIAAWRPGKPHPETWNDCFNQAWHLLVP